MWIDFQDPRSMASRRRLAPGRAATRRLWSATTRAREKGSGECSAVRQEDLPTRVTNLLVNCFSGRCPLRSSLTRIHQACGRRWAATSVLKALSGKCNVIVDTQGQHCSLWLKGHRSAEEVPVSLLGKIYGAATSLCKSSAAAIKFRSRSAVLLSHLKVLFH